MFEIFVLGTTWLLAGCVVAVGLGGIISRMQADKSDPVPPGTGGSNTDTDTAAGEELLGG